MSFDLKKSFLITMCWLLTSSSSIAETNSNLIFPKIPLRLTSIPTLQESSNSSNVIFIGSEFCFAIPLDGDLNQTINSDQSSNLKIKITDSSNQAFELTPEIIKSTNNNIQALFKVEALSTDTVEGNGTIDIILNDESLAQDKIFISKTLASRLEVPSNLATEINSVTLLNKVFKDKPNKIKILIGGNNVYRKSLPYNDSVLVEKRGLTYVSLLPRNEFFSIHSKVLKGNEVIRLKTFLKKKKFESTILILVASPFGLEIKSVSISKCNGRTCGEN